MQPVSQDITIYQGDTFEFFFRVRDRVWNPALNGGTGGYEAGDYVDLSGWTGKSQIRATAAATAVLAEFTVTLSDQNTTPGGVLLSLTPVQTASLPVSPAVWDVQLTNATAEVRTFIKGAVTVEAEVTRA